MILSQLLQYHTTGMQQTRLSLLLNLQMSLEEVVVEVVVEVEIVAKLEDEGSQLGLLGQSKISLRMFLLTRMEPFGGLLHKMEVGVACKA